PRTPSRAGPRGRASPRPPARGAARPQPPPPPPRRARPPAPARPSREPGGPRPRAARSRAARRRRTAPGRPRPPRHGGSVRDPEQLRHRRLIGRRELVLLELLGGDPADVADPDRTRLGAARERAGVHRHQDVVVLVLG